MFRQMLVVVKGAGDLASGTIHRLHRAGFSVVATELTQPLALRRTVAFAEAVYTGSITIEGLTGARAENCEDARAVLARGQVPVLIDPLGSIWPTLAPAWDGGVPPVFQPAGEGRRAVLPGGSGGKDALQLVALVDGTLAKRNLGTHLSDAPVVIALGPGFEAGVDAHAVIETNRGHNLGRVYLTGLAEANTGMPGEIGGATTERLLRAPAYGPLTAYCAIGDIVSAGDMVAAVGHEPVRAAIDGVLRGLVHEGLIVPKGMKIGDIDPRARREHCFSISDKSRAIAGGVLEALLYLLNIDAEKNA
jgi:xanthine dehydrogenase accessory factor